MAGCNDNHRYDDIIHLPHHVSNRHPQMSMMNRAAQFAPFAALVGHDAAIRETARLTGSKIEMDEYEKEELNRRIRFVENHLGEELSVVIHYFLPDSKKDGGSYVDTAGVVRKIDEYEQEIVLTDGSKIPIDNILTLEIE